MKIPLFSHSLWTNSNCRLRLAPMLTSLVAAAQVAELARAQQARADAERAERDARDAVRRTRAAERERLARELHDAVGHTVSVIVLQADAARLALPSEDSDARRLVTSIEDTGLGALGELDRLLGLLSAENGPDRTPPPTLDQLETLVDSVQATGLQVTAQRDGPTGQLPRSLDASAYRLAQESLTNTLKHANATEARVCISVADGILDLQVTDNGEPLKDNRASATGQPDAGPARGGRGLGGMRERVHLFDGELNGGARDAGGWFVHARISLQPEAS